MENTNSVGVNQLAQVFQERMKGLQGMVQTPLDFGEIQADMSLILNNFPRPIPQSDYMVCRSVQWGNIGDVWGNTQEIGKENSGKHRHGTNGEHSQPDAGYGGAHEHPENNKEMEHIHDVIVGEKFRSLLPGDRVLAARIGDDFCVIDLIFPASKIN